MLIKEINDKQTWENFLLECQEKTFLQSWNWGEFQKSSGNKIWRLGVYEESSKLKAQSSKPQLKDQNFNIVAIALVIKVEARRGKFLLVPHGPVIKNPNVKIQSSNQIQNPKSKILEKLLEELKILAKEEGCSFIRVSPICERTRENRMIFQALGFRPAPIHMHPEASWKLDITPPEEKLLMKMRKTTRYLIRQAIKNSEIEIYESQELKDLEIFNKLYKEVVRTQHFVPFSLDYLKNEFSAFQQDNQVSLFFAKYKGEIVASAFVLFWSGIGFYHHAALSPKYRKIPIAYLLQWQAIKEAKKRDCFLYDFWGYVNPKKMPEHPWAGPTLFKMGFGGRPALYLQTRDLPLSRRYWLTFVFEKIRKLKRSL